MSAVATAGPPASASGAPRRVARVLQAGRNVWRTARAHRASVLIDAGDYFAAVRAAMREAHHSIQIVGWDIDSRTRLVGPDGDAHDGLPATLGAFLTALVERRPHLAIRLLLWDYSLLYSLQRELLPGLTLGWSTPPQIDFCFDDVLPIGAAHHQKMVVIDDAVAFCGGLDLTIRRWDTPDHRPEDAGRVDPAGEPYPPFHDVQMMVDGPAAAALADLARRRWARAACQILQPAPMALPDPWPREVPPMFRNVTVGVSRTQPRFGGDREVREVEALYLDMIRAAERTIYVENQFLTSLKIADALAERLRAVPALETVIVVPKTHHSWVEQQTMLNGRIRFQEILRKAGVADRVCILYPQVAADGEPTEIKVHSKLMIVDDRLLRIGSSNICNRSMGVDTECDLTIEADDEAACARIVEVRNRLIAEHCGLPEAAVAAAIDRETSLLRAIDGLGTPRRNLQPVEDGPLPPGEPALPVDAVADPERPISAADYFAAFDTAPSRIGRTSVAIKTAMAAVAAVLLLLAWRYTPLSELAQPQNLTAWFSSLAGTPWAPVIIVGLFMLAGLVAFPVTVLIACTAAAFGTWPGIAIAGTGAMASALLTYLIGLRLGANYLRRLLGHRINRVSRNIAERGIVAIMAIRLAPIAPFTVVNLVTGAARVPVVDYLIGTALGLAPGLILMSALGERIFHALTEPTAGTLALVVGLLILWAGLAFGLQALVVRWRR